MRPGFCLGDFELKKSWIENGVKDNSWFTLYHDATLLACRFNDQGEIVQQWGGM
jgi:hypothetical protein